MKSRLLIDQIMQQTTEQRQRVLSASLDLRPRRRGRLTIASLLFWFTQVVISESVACPPHMLEVSMESATPLALQTGLTQGIGVGYLYQRSSSSDLNDTQSEHQEEARCARWMLAMGGRASYRSSEEGSLSWQVVHDEARLSAEWTLTRATGSGGWGIALGGGGVYVREEQIRHQAERLKQGESAPQSGALTDKASQVLAELTVRPLARLRLIKTSLGHIGISSAAELAWRFPSGNLPSATPAWGWGIHVGAYLSFGGVGREINQEVSPKLERSQSNSLNASPIDPLRGPVSGLVSEETSDE